MLCCFELSAVHRSSGTSYLISFSVWVRSIFVHIKSCMLLLHCEVVVCWCRAAANVQFDGPSGTRYWRDVTIPGRAYKASGSCWHDCLCKYHHNCMSYLRHLNSVVCII